MKYKFNNLTLILGSYKCNKNCPYCIAKNNMKFDNLDDRLDCLDNVMSDLLNSNIYFNKFVLSGNGEPSLYDLNTLKKIKDILIKNRDLFGGLRIHSSGNIFFENDKFNLFNDRLLNPEFEILRVAINSDVDKSVLWYDRDYLNSDGFKNALNVKCDIAFTDYLERENLTNELTNLLTCNPQISVVRFKKLMVGDNNSTKQAKWVVDHTLRDDYIDRIMLEITNNCGIYSSVIYDEVGNYDNDYVINCGKLQDYNYNMLISSDLVKRRKLNG